MTEIEAHDRPVHVPAFEKGIPMTSPKTTTVTFTAGQIAEIRAVLGLPGGTAVTAAHILAAIADDDGALLARAAANAGQPINIPGNATAVRAAAAARASARKFSAMREGHWQRWPS